MIAPHATRSPASLRRGFVIAITAVLIVFILIGVLLAALNAGRHRPEGAAERWLAAVSDTGRDRIRDDAVERAGDIGPVSLAKPILPAADETDGEHRLFADLEVGRAVRSGDTARVPFRVHQREVDDGERLGTLVLREQEDGTWRLTGLDDRRSGEEVPSEGGDPPSSAPIGVWVLGVALATGFAFGASALIRFAGRPPAGPPGQGGGGPPSYEYRAVGGAGMNRSTIVRRYLPLAAVAALQLGIIAVVPSKAPNEVSAAGVDGTGGQPFVPGGAGDPTATLPSGELVNPGDGGTGALPGSTATVPGQTGTEAPGTSGSAGGLPSGDTSHCVGGRQFNPADFPWPPPCAGKFAGDNGGATYRGVSAEQIKVVVLRGNYGALVNAVLAAQGSFPTDEQFQGFLDASSAFVNARYELYGRKIVFKGRQLQCSTGGQGVPDDQCLRQEMRQIVAEENPFSVIWINAVSSASYDELSRLKVLNLGGYGFTDTFNRNHAPYHWDVQIGGNQLATIVGDWWCKRMNGQKAVFAGRNGNNDPMFERTRVLGVLSTNDPENRVIASLLENEIHKCGSRIAHKYFYDQNIQTLTQQRAAAVAAMRESPAATSVFCFCDQVAPQFLYTGFNRQDYYPENLIPATGLMDTDQVGQSMDHGAEDSGRPANEYPQFENAFGLAQFGREEPLTGNVGARVWQKTGHTGAAPVRLGLQRLRLLRAARQHGAGRRSAAHTRDRAGRVVPPGPARPGPARRAVRPALVRAGRLHVERRRARGLLERPQALER